MIFGFNQQSSASSAVLLNYWLRQVEDIRVFYDVTDNTVEVLAIVPKSRADEWLARYGESDETSGAV